MRSYMALGRKGAVDNLLRERAAPAPLPTIPLRPGGLPSMETRMQPTSPIGERPLMPPLTVSPGLLEQAARQRVLEGPGAGFQPRTGLADAAMGAPARRCPNCGSTI